MSSLLSEDLHLELILSLKLVLCRVAAVQRLPVHHHSEITYFLVLWNRWAYSESVKNRVPLMPVLGGVDSVVPLHYCTRKDSIKPSLVLSFL